MLEKSRSLPAVDCVAYDLEDSVTPTMKEAARRNVRGILERKRVGGIWDQAVRINSVGSGLAEEDLREVLQSSSNIDTLVVPKVNSASDLQFVTDVLRHILPQRHPSTPPSLTSATSAPPIQILALIESALALTSLPAICTASPYLSGLIFAAEDFAADLSITRTPSLTEFLYARSAIVTHARAYSLPSVIDLVCTGYSGLAGMQTLERECANGASMGFNGKQCIHPSQVDVAQKLFAASEGEVVWAIRVMVTDEKAGRAGKGAWALDGKMVDRPVVWKARSIVERAKREGVVDIEAIIERWKGQEPE
ncbi:hypothetical protein FGG08_004355 [Glutinoglossum americanum]|uniref:HpcH/HpaI aldolase/citrate lyase domain-containing protein n=1 Tax=Glutinoglossum americanum TaxID=1670608 RepID=A0A9P8L2U6_9PEZI|nr:hypothetical protein FGG08_004355 [Glutinoglossum americanum]